MSKRRKLTRNQKIALAGVIIAAIGVIVRVTLTYLPEKDESKISVLPEPIRIEERDTNELIYGSSKSSIESKEGSASNAEIEKPIDKNSQQIIPPSILPGKSLGNSKYLSVITKYHPSGKMGDINDITVQRYEELDRFIYETTGRGRHEWEWKYVNGKLNDEPAKFAGVMYLDPPNNWGTRYGGFDLRDTSESIRWEARSLGEDLHVEFVIGGINWIWDEAEKKIVSPPYPDSMPRTSLGTKKLTQNWQSFDYSFSDQPPDYFLRVIGGFGFVITWGAKVNGDGISPESQETSTIEIRNIHYERR